MFWHAIPWPDVVRALGADSEQGLTSEDAQRRLRETGPNRMPARRPRSWLSRIAAPAGEFFVLLLLAAAAVSWLLGQRVDALAIALIVAVNIALGAAQEHRAERALAALRTLAAPNAQVIRDGIPRTIPTSDLVLGDLVVLTSGARVPADLRLVETHVLTVDESLLTGEAAAASKEAEGICPADAPLAERNTLAFLGTAVGSGRGRGVVIRTGAQTELGALAGAVDSAPPKRTPLTERLSALGR
ncbi:MAG TPA: cation-transporting P-type ATPase, partial [bacterium]|nr:cation-transporting P-type ATPase [bacterium]